MTFDELGLNEVILEAISYMGFEKATPVQEQAIPTILEGKDLIACAQTGTGKTGAFLLPLIHRMIADKAEKAQALILVPTRELAQQIDQQAQGILYYADLHSCTVYGGGDGQSFDREKFAIRNKTDIIIATPGRLLAHLKSSYADFSNVKYWVLDEADRMLDMGFIEDILEIEKYVKNRKQTLMFSATMAPKIRKLAHSILNEPSEINLAISKPAEGVDQKVILAHDSQKTAILRTALTHQEEDFNCIIFCSRKKKVFELVRDLKRYGIAAEGISSELEQNEREEILQKFRSGRCKILVATDVMSRGIDIKNLSMVVNFDVPGAPEDYVHRIGRTARNDSKGRALTLVNQADMFKFHRIEQLIERELEKDQPEEKLGAGPEWNIRKDSKPANKRRGFKKPNNRSNSSQTTENQNKPEEEKKRFFKRKPKKE